MFRRPIIVSPARVWGCMATFPASPLILVFWPLRTFVGISSFCLSHIPIIYIRDITIKSGKPEPIPEEPFPRPTGTWSNLNHSPGRSDLDSCPQILALPKCDPWLFPLFPAWFTLSSEQDTWCIKPISPTLVSK